MSAATVGGLGALLSTGCSSDTAQLVTAEAKSFFAPGKHQKYGLSPEEIDGFEYPALGVTIGDGDPFILILAEANGDDSLWASANHQFFWFRGARLVRTSGLAVDLASVSWQDKQDPVAQATTLILTGNPVIQADQSLRQLGFVDLGQADSSPIHSKVNIGAATKITINDRERSARIIDERWDATSWRWKSKSRFWIDPVDATPWRSIQHYAPGFQPIEFELIKTVA